jgi:HD superfamily phosphodiesterase
MYMLDIAQLIANAITFDAGDSRRIHHFLKVYTYADTIGRLEHIPLHTLQVLQMAAVLHDIGIHAAEAKYGNSSGKYQELEGPAPARLLLEALHCPEADVDRVCFLIAHHHTYTHVDGLDQQILLEADFLVNAHEDALNKQAICTFRDTLFRTKSGIQLLNDTYGL